ADGDLRLRHPAAEGRAGEGGERRPGAHGPVGGSVARVCAVRWSCIDRRARAFFCAVLPGTAARGSTFSGAAVSSGPRFTRQGCGQPGPVQENATTEGETYCDPCATEVTAMPRVCFIVNPIAGRGRALACWKQIEPLAARLGEYGVKFTERPGHAIELARLAVQEGYDRVVSLGGDGTLNEVGNGLVGTDAALAVIAAGRGNDWVRTTGVPTDAAEGCRLAFEGRVARLDVGLARGYRYFFNAAGFGFDAEVCVRVDRYGKRFPKLSYLRGVFDTL